MTAFRRKPVTVTTSWDDGHSLDLRLAEILDEYRLPGTFYISPASVELAPAERLSRSEIAIISERFEIGAHTYTHPRLTSLTKVAARKEIIDGRTYLEDVTGRQVRSFCYPGGVFAPEHVHMVREAGFTYARTVERFALDAGADPLRSPTTVHAYSHLVDIVPAFAHARFNPLTAWNLYCHWDRMAMRLFDRVLQEGGVFHLWGHSWEIDQHNQWAALRRVCAYIADRPGVRYFVNGAIPCNGGKTS
jgi:peptidoglycan/xylan/chitin deacetylase (PgdA/CDA1 family)